MRMASRSNALGVSLTRSPSRRSSRRSESKTKGPNGNIAAYADYTKLIGSRSGLGDPKHPSWLVTEGDFHGHKTPPSDLSVRRLLDKFAVGARAEQHHSG